MSGSQRISGRRARAGTRVALLATHWHATHVARMVEGARRALVAQGVSPSLIDVHHVPGAWELPFGAMQLSDGAAGVRYDLIVALGCVVRGGTPHFEFVAGECARGLMAVQLRGAEGQPPIAFGVLTTDDERQAAERADPEGMDKGGEAALAGLAMLGFAGEAGA